MNQAFVPGAGLGTRLRPLTSLVPKPLVPLFHRPLIEYALQRIAALGTRRIAINTHHLAASWENFGGPSAPAEPATIAANGLALTRRSFQGVALDFFHEPILLNTGGGPRNLLPWLEPGPLLVHNGDIFSSLPLDRLVAAHRQLGTPVTLAIRSHGPALHIALDRSGNFVTDIHHLLGRAHGSHLFTGIYCIERDFLATLPHPEPVGIIPSFLGLAQRGKLGAVVIDEGDWIDLGDRAAYLGAHRVLALAPPIHPESEVASDAVITASVIGPGAIVGRGSRVTNSVLWPGAHVADGANLRSCIVLPGPPVTGHHLEADLPLPEIRNHQP